MTRINTTTLFFLVWSLIFGPLAAKADNPPVTEDFDSTVGSVAVPGEESPTSYLMLSPQGVETGKKCALLIYLYGAGGSHTAYNLADAPYAELRRSLSELGFFVLVPDLGPKHFMNNRAQKALDVILEHVLQAYPVDPARIHLMGTSMGGGSALAYAIHRPELARSVCAVIPMTDLSRWYREAESYREDLIKALGGTPAAVPQAYESFSALFNLDSFRRIPVFLIGAEKDVKVLPDHARLLARGLSEKGYTVIYREAPGVGHSNQAFAPFAGEVVEFLKAAERPH